MGVAMLWRGYFGQGCNLEDERLSEEKDLGTNTAVTEADSSPASSEDNSDIEDISEEIKKKPKKKKEKQDTSVKQFRQKKKNGWIKWLVIILAAVGIISFVVYKVIDTKNKFAEALSGNDTTTAEITRMDLSKAISATGTIQSKDVRTITSPLSGVKIEKVHYKVGDMVQQGDVVVEFSFEDINKKIDQIEEDITEAKTVKGLDSGDRNNTHVNDYDNQTYKVATAYEALQQKGDELQRAKDDLQKICSEKGDYKRNHSNDQTDPNYDPSYDTTIKNYEDREITAQRNIEDAQRAYDKAFVEFNKAGYDASYNNAKSDYNYSKGNVQANDNVKSLERQLEQNQDSLDNYIVTAPISGIITAVNAQEGNGYQASTGALFTVQAVEIYEVTTQIDEYDINNVKVGQSVAIMTDATGEDELEGRVTFIAPIATSASSGSAATGSSASSSNSFEVKIDIVNKDERLKLGMSAKLNILIDTHKNVLAVPYDAIEQKEDGQTVIYAVDNSKDAKAPEKDSSDIKVIGLDGLINKDDKESKDDKSGSSGMSAGKANAKEIPVQIGLESDYYTEIISKDISEGMTVLVNGKAGELANDLSMFMEM